MSDHTELHHLELKLIRKELEDRLLKQAPLEAGERPKIYVEDAVNILLKPPPVPPISVRHTRFAKDELRAKIAHLLQEFSELTGTEVTAVNLEAIQVKSGVEYIVSVEVSL